MTLVPLIVRLGTWEGRGTVKTLVSTGSTFFIDLCRHIRLNVFWLSISFSSQICIHLFLMCCSVFIFLSSIPSYHSPLNLHNLILLSVGQAVCVCVCVCDIILLTYHWIHSSTESLTKSDNTSRTLHSFWAA